MKPTKLGTGDLEMMNDEMEKCWRRIRQPAICAAMYIYIFTLQITSTGQPSSFALLISVAIALARMLRPVSVDIRLIPLNGYVTDNMLLPSMRSHRDATCMYVVTVGEVILPTDLTGNSAIRCFGSFATNNQPP